MKLNLYSLYDRIGEEYGPLFADRNDAAAIRVTRNSLEKSPFPQDFSLRCVGIVDTTTGAIAPVHPVRLVEYEPALPESSPTS